MKADLKRMFALWTSLQEGGHLEHAVTHSAVTFEAELRAHIQPQKPVCLMRSGGRRKDEGVVASAESCFFCGLQILRKVECVGGGLRWFGGKKGGNWELGWSTAQRNTDWMKGSGGKVECALFFGSDWGRFVHVYEHFEDDPRWYLGAWARNVCEYAHACAPASVWGINLLCQCSPDVGPFQKYKPGLSNLVSGK